MLKQIKEFFSADDQTDTNDDAHDEVLAAAMLLLEVAWADHELEERELATIRSALTDLYQISEDEIDTVIEKAQEAHDASVGIYPFTSLLNEHLAHDAKQRLLEHLWRMNTFEGAEFHYEEYMIRRIADLLYCTHEEFIAAKLNVKNQVS